MLSAAHLPIQDAATRFDWMSIADVMSKVRSERQKVLEEFPLADWPTLPLERYAIGQENRTQGTYCWWLEYGTKDIGRMVGFDASRHLIYKHSKQPGWFFDEEQYADERVAWQAVRAGVVEALDKGGQGRWNEIDEIAVLRESPGLRLKTLFIYFPDDVLPITAPQHLQYFLRLLGRAEADDPSQGVVRLNRALLAAVREVPGLGERTPQEIEKFLYRWAHPHQTRRVVKIAPGHGAGYWEDCERDGMICVGWDQMGDLLAYPDKTAFKEEFLSTFAEDYTPQKGSTKGNELWTFRELEPGDIIVANEGISHILAVGVVVEPGYEWRADRAEFKHTVRVDWDTSYACDIEPQKYWAVATVVKVPTELFDVIMNRTPHDPAQIPVVVPSLYAELAETLDRKKQAILYGPPGTGKTYAARRFAAWWLLNRSGDPANAAAALGGPHALAQAEEALAVSSAGARRVWWVVASPKIWAWDALFKNKTVGYNYGRIQRNYPLVQPGDLVVGYQASPDKRIVALARVKRGLHTPLGGEPQIELEAIAPIKDGPTYDELLADPQLKNSEPMRLRNQGTLFALTDEEAEDLLEELVKRDPSLKAHLHTGSPVGRLTRLTFHGSYSYEDFIEGFRPIPRGTGEGLTLQLTDGVFKQICRQAQLRPDEPFLVLIDEINRANVAKVFGEIITLLEADKRGLMITLPQSREPFAIPPNVFLLGTMNTADRSIKLLDAALRRRFAFLELMPDPTLLHGGQIGPLDLETFLTELNRRIANRTDREKQIGHSFLLEDGAPVFDAVEFCRRFRQEILPLLQEYSYEDYASLAYYLGDELVDKNAQSLNADLLRDPIQLPVKLAAEYSQAAGTAEP